MTHTSSHPSSERTLVIIKPDGIQRALVAEILGRYERLGLKLVGMKLMVPTAEQVEGHYLLDPNWKKNVGEKSIASYEKKGETPPSSDPIAVGDMVVERLRKYLTAGPVLAMVWQGGHSVELVRKVTGGTEPRGAQIGTIRGDFVVDSYQMADSDDRAIRNLIHASGSVDEANMEIPHWFSDAEIIDYNLSHEDVLYGKEMEGILN